MQLIAEYKWKIHWDLLSAQLGCKPPLPPCEVRICVVASTVPVNLKSNIKGTRQPMPLSSLLPQPCLCHCKTPPNHQLRWAASLILHGGSTPKIKQKHLWPFTPPHTFSFWNHCFSATTTSKFLVTCCSLFYPLLCDRYRLLFPRPRTRR